MATDALSTCFTRSSATMVLNMQDKQSFVFHRKGLKWPVPSLVKVDLFGGIWAKYLSWAFSIKQGVVDTGGGLRGRGREAFDEKWRGWGQGWIGRGRGKKNLNFRRSVAEKKWEGVGRKKLDGDLLHEEMFRPVPKHFLLQIALLVYVLIVTALNLSCHVKYQICRAWYQPAYHMDVASSRYYLYLIFTRFNDQVVKACITCSGPYYLNLCTDILPLHWRHNDHESWGHLKSPASRLFAQLFIQKQIKENIKAPRYWLLCGEFTRKMFPFDDVIMSYDFSLDIQIQCKVHLAVKTWPWTLITDFKLGISIWILWHNSFWKMGQMSGKLL